MENFQDLRIIFLPYLQEFVINSSEHGNLFKEILEKFQYKFLGKYLKRIEFLLRLPGRISKKKTLQEDLKELFVDFQTVFLEGFLKEHMKQLWKESIEVSLKESLDKFVEEPYKKFLKEPPGKSLKSLWKNLLKKLSRIYPDMSGKKIAGKNSQDFLQNS